MYIYIYMYPDHQGNPHTPSLPTEIIPTKIRWLRISGRNPINIRIPPLKSVLWLSQNLRYAWYRNACSRVPTSFIWDLTTISPNLKQPFHFNRYFECHASGKILLSESMFAFETVVGELLVKSRYESLRRLARPARPFSKESLSNLLVSSNILSNLLVSPESYYQAYL